MTSKQILKQISQKNYMFNNPLQDTTLGHSKTVRKDAKLSDLLTMLKCNYITCNN